MKYSCELCGYTYDEQMGDVKRGIAPGTGFRDLPEDFECPGCGYEKEAFNPVSQTSVMPWHLQTSMRPALRK